METIELIIEDLGYYNSDTGKNRPSIDGLNNKGNQKFKHRGHKHPQLSTDHKDKILRRKKVNGKWYFQMDTTDIKSIIVSEDPKFKIKKITKKEDQIVFPVESGVTE